MASWNLVKAVFFIIAIFEMSEEKANLGKRQHIAKKPEADNGITKEFPAGRERHHTLLNILTIGGYFIQKNSNY